MCKPPPVCYGSHLHGVPLHEACCSGTLLRAACCSGTLLHEACCSGTLLHGEPCCDACRKAPCCCSLCRSHVDVLLLARTALGTALPQARRRISLSGLTEAVLGRSLDKAEQCSAWGERPLRTAQLLYAAGDAHCVVALYTELNRRRVGLETPFWVSHFSGGCRVMVPGLVELRAALASSMLSDQAARKILLPSLWSTPPLAPALRLSIQAA